MTDVLERLSQLRANLSSNLLAPDDFVDWEAVERRLNTNAPHIARLQTLIANGDLSRAELAQELGQNPSIYPLLLDLLAFNSTGAQVEKWGLPESVGRDPVRNERIADQLFYVGINRLIHPGTDVASLLRVAEVYKDGNRRRFRSGKKLEDRVRALVTTALREANAELATPLSINSSTIPDLSLRRGFSYVISLGNRPVAGIATVFQNQSGGRQLRDLSFTYPNLQQRLYDYGASLILFVDGQGVQEASDRVLVALIEGVRFPVTLSEAADGKLKGAIVDAATSELPQTLDQAALNRLIEEQLRVKIGVSAQDLPVGPDPARLALAAFVSTRRRANLVLSPNGDRIEWGRPEWIRRARNVRAIFDAKAAFDLFLEMLGSDVESVELEDDTVRGEVTAPPVQPFNESLHVTASSQDLNADLAREIGRRSMERAPRSSVAIYLTPNGVAEEDLPQHRKNQILIAANIIAVSSTLLEQMASDKRPLDRLVDAINMQSDLTKVSPFVLSNPTPSRMFYGRVSEAATVQRTLASNSVAILGSRRMGKTSLIRRLRDDLSKSNFAPFFGDCQTVKTWSDFALLAKKAWNVSVPDDFRPSHLETVVDQLAAKGNSQVVVILDEIDHLISWDQRHNEDTVPEAFFRSCRSISQAGTAQFVFSGERTIASRLWDAHSPHWNFCRELQLTQLDKADATSLLIEPLLGMNIRLPDRDVFADIAWERTSGHPQLVQYLGDRLVKLLDERVDRRELTLTSENLLAIANTSEFADHYLTTYWGQATRLEKAISERIARGEVAPAELFTHLQNQGFDVDHEMLLGSIRMLQLYGIVTDRGEQLALRATWFPDALGHFESVIEDRLEGADDAPARAGTA